MAKTVTTGAMAWLPFAHPLGDWGSDALLICLPAEQALFMHRASGTLLSFLVFPGTVYAVGGVCTGWWMGTLKRRTGLGGAMTQIGAIYGAVALLKLVVALLAMLRCESSDWSPLARFGAAAGVSVFETLCTPIAMALPVTAAIVFSRRDPSDLAVSWKETLVYSSASALFLTCALMQG